MSSTERIALVGIGLRYPDSNSPQELWSNVLAGRRAFRRLPDERMSHSDYYSEDPQAPDRFYSSKAAVLRDYEFDRVAYRVAGSTFRATDMTHWLALDVAAAALADAGFPNADGLSRDTTGVVLGNTLTGEFSRANVMRLRWPYVRRTVAAALAGKGWSEAETGEFLAGLEESYKAPFPPIDEDSLAGGLANTIAGRICNYFDLRGGGFTVDGACSSSLLSVTSAAKALVDKDLDVALAGGVDLSIDPFEVIGFAKTGALATGEMKVYDRDSNGFWPGEGCGIVVMMREADALAQGRRIYSLITGWGVSSDGTGGITRPEAGGHRLALTRAYERAGYGVDEVSYFEGHGTGTALGDATEIEALSEARRAAGPGAAKAALSSVKGNFGHTKAAAGVAGLIKATLAVHHQVIPPATGHDDPHPKLLDEAAALFVPGEAHVWPGDKPMRAGISAMGFGGINTHVAIEQAADVERTTDLGVGTRDLVAGRQDAEVLLMDADDQASIRSLIAQVTSVVEKISYAELSDLAYTLASGLSSRPVRAAVVAATPDEAGRKLERLTSALEAGEVTIADTTDGVFLGRRETAGKIAYLFPGQGSGRGTHGAVRRRFGVAEETFRTAGADPAGDQTATQNAQPRIVTGSLAAVRTLRHLGIDAEIAAGHSLGELSALAWAGAMDGTHVIRLATVRGRVMARASSEGGAMASISSTPDDTLRVVDGCDVVIAGYNGPQQTVISGAADAVDTACRRARAEGIDAINLNVSHAFHSSFVEPAAEGLSDELAEMTFGRLRRPVVSTVTGAVLDSDTDLRELLRSQVLEPVRFHQAAERAVADADLAVEVGPGRVLTGLVNTIAPGVPALAVDTDSRSLVPLLRVVAAAHTVGARIDTTSLFAGRGVKALPLDTEFSFLANPCETAPELDADLVLAAPVATTATPGDTSSESTSGVSTFDLLCRLAAERVELPLEAVTADSHPLDDLHLSSITVGQLVNDVTNALGRPALTAPPNFATTRIGELADMIDQLAETARDDDAGGEVPGVAAWVRPFSVEYTEQAPPAPVATTDADRAEWTLFSPSDHPLADRLTDALATAGLGDGVLVCLPESGEPHYPLFLDAAKSALAAKPGTRFVVVQGKLGATGLARTLHLESPDTAVTVVALADVVPREEGDARVAIRRVVAEVANTTAFCEVRYDATGRRTVPLLRAIPAGTTEPPEENNPLGAADVLLVTGGGKGITAECAMALAKDSGSALALVGRSDPADDPELASNLERMADAGIALRYEQADVTSAEQVNRAVEAVVTHLGPITAVLHGAGRNQPVALESLTEEEFTKTIAPKICGLRAVLDAVDPAGIKLLITFGSIIGRAGLRGEAHYATANDWMSELTADFLHENPQARALALEWSIWAGAGMGEKLGVVEALARDGITPISVEDGIGVLRRAVNDSRLGPVVMVGGRTGGLPTLNLEQSELPLLRFLDQAVVHYPGVELITQADLSVTSDPYLLDHELDGTLLFPAVVGMEAMCQVGAVVSGAAGRPVIEDMEFMRPISVRPDSTTTIRIAALARDEGVDVVIRSDETGFGADHFRARLCWPAPDVPGSENTHDDAVPPVPVDPSRELYGSVMFQGPRFQRLLRYRRAAARHAVAEIAAGSQDGWFGAFFPQECLLADPGTRDVAMHALQCCVPHATLLPEGVDRLYLAQHAGDDVEHVVLDARERFQDGDVYTYDLDLRSPSGDLVERWEGLRLRAVRHKDTGGPWVPAMLSAYLERSLEHVLGGTRAVVVEPQAVDGSSPNGAGPDHSSRTAIAVRRALGRRATIRYRPDGKPETDGAQVSASHNAPLTMAIAGDGRLACDVESVTERDDQDWTGLLGGHQAPLRDLLAREESPDLAGTRVWAAVECLRKAGTTATALTVDEVYSDGWVLLSAGDVAIATWATRVNDQEQPVVFAVLADAPHTGKERA